VRRSTRLHQLTAALLLIGAVGCNSPTTSPPKTNADVEVKLRGMGSSFVRPMMDRWIQDFTSAKGGEVNYQAGGSTAGVKAMLEKSVDFGATDAGLTTAQLETARKGGGVVYVPLVMGGIVPAYNLEGLGGELHLTGAVLAGIYLGDIKKWSDDRIKHIQGNESLRLPDKDIAVVYRSDGSGSTNIFTDYLIKASPEFKKEYPAPANTVKWKVGSGESGTAAVAGFIRKTPYSIGYVELTYAIQNKIAYAFVQNKEGKFVKASVESVSEAGAQALKDHIPDELFFSITDAPGEQSYPIAGTTWAVFYAQQPAGMGSQLVSFFGWVVHDGQELAKGLDYSRLPPKLVEKIDAKLKTVK